MDNNENNLRKVLDEPCEINHCEFRNEDGTTHEKIYTIYEGEAFDLYKMNHEQYPTILKELSELTKTKYDKKSLFFSRENSFNENSDDDKKRIIVFVNESSKEERPNYDMTMGSTRTYEGIILMLLFPKKKAG